MQKVLKQITRVLSEWVSGKKTGKLTFEINISQGGIGKCNLRTEGSLE